MEAPQTRIPVRPQIFLTFILAMHIIKTEFVTALSLKNYLDISSAYVGKHISSPYEVTIDESWRTIWQGMFL